MGYMEHDAECEALTILGVMVSRWHLMNREEAGRVIEALKFRPEMRDPSVVMSERVCACGARRLLTKESRMKMIETWGKNMGDHMYKVLGEEKRVEVEGRLNRLLSGFEGSTNDESPDEG